MLSNVNVVYSEYTCGATVVEITVRVSEIRPSLGFDRKLPVYYVPGRYSFDVEILEADEYPLVGGAVEDIMAHCVAWVDTGEVGRREAAIGRNFASIDEPTV